MQKLILPLILILYAVSDAQAEDSQFQGKELAKSWRCTHCHGLSGNQRDVPRVGYPSRPMIAGQPKAYLVKRLMQYKLGELVDDHKKSNMSWRAEVLSDQEIDVIAEYYSSQKRY